MTRALCERIYDRFAQDNPSPQGELHYSSSYTLLVAVILSAQASDRSVNLATATLFRAASTPRAMLRLGEEGIKSHIRSIGLFNSKARAILATSRLLLERHSGQVPRTREDLEALPGVGRKTANVVLNTAFAMPTIAVDTHVFRVANRTGMASASSVRAVEDALQSCTPQRYAQRAHQWLILHGRYTCLARKPRCATCLIRDLCSYPGRYPDKSAPASAPASSSPASSS